MRKAEFFRNPNSSPITSGVTNSGGTGATNQNNPHTNTAATARGTTSTVETPKRPRSVPTVRSRRLVEKSDFRTRFLQHETDDAAVDVAGGGGGGGGDTVSGLSQQQLPGNQVVTIWIIYCL